MSLLRVAARRATPMITRAGRRQASNAPHFDPFDVDAGKKKQKVLYYTAAAAILAAPAFAIRYQLKRYKSDTRSFG